MLFGSFYVSDISLLQDIRGSFTKLTIRFTAKKSPYSNLEGITCQDLKISCKGKRKFSGILPKVENSVSIQRLTFSEENFSQFSSSLTSLVLVNTQQTPDLTQFPNLHTLKLIACGLKEPSYLPPRLRVLNLSSNDFRSFPTAIQKLSHLETLQISNTRFTALPKDMSSFKHLPYLSLCSSNVEDLSPLTTLPNLKRLRIGYGGFNATQYISRPEVIPALPSGLQITELYIHGIIRVAFNSYKNHSLAVLDFHRSTEEIGVHLLKEFGAIKKVIGFEACGTQITNQENFEEKRTLVSYGAQEYGLGYLCYP